MARGFVPALAKPYREMNIFKTLLRIKEPSELRAALEELANGFEYDSQYARHNKYIESEPVRSSGPIFFGPTQDDLFQPSYSDLSSDDNSTSFGGGDFGGGGSGGEW